MSGRGRVGVGVYEAATDTQMEEISVQVSSSEEESDGDVGRRSAEVQECRSAGTVTGRSDELELDEIEMDNDEVEEDQDVEEQGENEMDDSDEDQDDEEQGEDQDGGVEDTDTGRSVSDSVLVLPKRKVKDPSPIWNECGAKVYNESGCVIGGKCNFCGKVYKSNTGNTSNLIRHVMIRHKDKAEVGRLSKERKILDAKRKSKKVEAEKKRKSIPTMLNFCHRKSYIDPVKKKKIDEAILKHIVMDNKPFSLVDSHSFRDMLFKAEPNYIVPSRFTITNAMKKEAKNVREVLKREIGVDIAPHKTINITSDHGTASDRFRTKKNALTVARCTSNFVIKRDTVDVITCIGSQTGKRIKEDVKNSLEKYAGLEDDWSVNWVTDNEKKQLNAKNPRKNREVPLNIKFTGHCVDHTFELVSEDTIAECKEMNTAVKKGRALVNFLKDSSLGLEAFYRIMTNAGAQPLSIIQGTDNRWFYKYYETHRLLILRDYVETWFNEYDERPDNVKVIEDEDWDLLTVYENSLRKVIEAATVLEGELYPTASSVIPFLDKIFHDLQDFCSQLPPGEGRDFVVKLLHNLKLQNRFPKGYMDVAPYNALTALDPRYSDLYFSQKEKEEAFEVILQSLEERESGNVTDSIVQSEDELPSQDLVPPTPPTTNSLEERRKQLLARKNSRLAAVVTETQTDTSFKDKVKEEYDRILILGGSLGVKENPNDWWRIHSEQFPNLSKFWLANCPFPATSTSSERVFSMDGLIMIDSRKSLTAENSKSLILCRDFWLSRSNQSAYRLCEKCPKPPSSDASYVITCSKHNKK